MPFLRQPSRLKTDFSGMRCFVRDAIKVISIGVRPTDRDNLRAERHSARVRRLDTGCETDSRRPRFRVSPNPRFGTGETENVTRTALRLNT
jgi:hypothetical protein